MFKSDILFGGYYGQKNTGDNAFVEVTSWAANTIWNQKNIRYLAKKKNLPITIHQKEGYPVSLPKTYEYQQKLLVNNTKIFISAGGSTFHREIIGNNAKDFALQRKLKNGGNFKLGAIGVSIGPFKSLNAERSVVNYIKNLDFLTVRDKRSYDFVSSLALSFNPVESFDMAALMPSIYTQNRRANKKKIIGVSLCNFERFTGGDLENEKRRNRKLSKLIKEIDSKDEIHFKFIIMNGHPFNGDKELTLQTILEANLKNTFDVFDYNKNTQEAWNLIASCDFMLSTRLHGAIFACFANTPFILVEYHQKCTDFLKDVGYDETLRVYDMNQEINKTGNQIMEIINTPSNYKFPLYTEQMKEKALLNFNSITL